jgi:hypothetical protein
MSGVELIAIAGLALQTIGTISSSRSARQQANAQAAALEQQAARERAVAGQEAEEFRRRARRTAGTQRALVGGAGVSAEGTPLLLFEDFAAESEFQAQRLLTGGLTEAATLETEAGLTRAAGKAAAKSALIGGVGTTLLSGAGMAGDFFGNPSSSLSRPKTTGSKVMRRRV